LISSLLHLAFRFIVDFVHLPLSALSSFLLVSPLSTSHPAETIAAASTPRRPSPIPEYVTPLPTTRRRRFQSSFNPNLCLSNLQSNFLPLIFISSGELALILGNKDSHSTRDRYKDNGVLCLHIHCVRPANYPGDRSNTTATQQPNDVCPRHLSSTSTLRIHRHLIAVDYSSSGYPGTDAAPTWHTPRLETRFATQMLCVWR
jgi:hypothetical protein